MKLKDSLVKFLSAHAINTEHVFFNLFNPMMIHADEESVKSLDDGSLLDLIQSNKFFGII